MRPAIKRHWTLRSLPDGRVLFGAQKNAKNIEIDEKVERLFELMDSTRDIEQISLAMREEFSDISRNDVLRVIQDLAEAGIVEDASIVDEAHRMHPLLSGAELSRYDRQLLFFSLFEKNTEQRYNYQAKLKQAHVTLLGCGGVGSHTFQNMARAGIGTLRVVDYDTVESSNLNRSFLFRTDDVGRRKIDVLKEESTQINPHLVYEFIDHKIASYEDVVQLTTGTDFVALCADTPYLQINRWVNTACLEQGIPYGMAGSSDESGTVGPITVPGMTSCFECQRFDQTDIYSGSKFVVRANKERKASSFVSVIASLAALNSLEIIKYLTGISTPKILNRQLMIDFDSLDFEYVELPRDPDCPSCSLKSLRKDRSA